MQVENYVIEKPNIISRKVSLIADATFFGKRKDKLGILVFKDNISRKIIIWKFIKTEKLSDYNELYFKLVDLGFIITGITIDGKRGLFKAFKNIQVQMCHFHQLQIITRYLTRNPRLLAAIELKKICETLTINDENSFTKLLENWYLKYQNFLNEKTYNTESKRWHYTHKRLRSAYKSLKANLPYLFTYKKNSSLKIANTTNSLDGGIFSPLKTLLRIHRGIKIELKMKLIENY
jgi:hypothetical protein